MNIKKRRNNIQQQRENNNIIKSKKIPLPLLLQNLNHYVYVHTGVRCYLLLITTTRM